MNHKQKFLTAAGMLALGFAAVPVSAQGHDVAADMEKCYGVAKAGKNDCASADGAHSCAGAAATDGSKLEWVTVPKGLCDKLAGGSTEAPKAE